MRIGIYGGTFNPIHNGHVNILKGFHNKLNLDKIIIIPTANPPHKKSPNLATAKHRIKMCELALTDLCYCEISDMEIKRQGKSYTIDTLIELKKSYDDDEIFLLMGEDMFLTIDKWLRFQEIFNLCTICTAPRSVDNFKKIEKFAKFIKKDYNNFCYKIIDVEYLKASSTEIRNGDYNTLDNCVLDYIKENNLYEEKQ